MTRAEFVKALACMPMIGPLNLFSNLQYAETKLPLVFIGHGSPDNAFTENAFTRQLHDIGQSLPFKPAAVLVISAHYLTQEETLLKVQPYFDNAYYKVKGAVDFEKTIAGISGIIPDAETNLDHGAWAILRHIFPDRDVPVMELSIPMGVPLSYHWQLAQQLKDLRNKGVLIVGSGNVVHNLELSTLKMLTGQKPYHWALEMDDWIKTNIDNRNLTDLYNYRTKGKAARLAINSSEHYIPMLYIMSMLDKHDNITHTYEEVLSAISMRCFKTT